MRTFLKNTKIRTKILILTSVTLFLMGLVIVFGLSQIKTIGREMSLVVEEDIPLLESLSRITFHDMGQKIHFKRAIQFGRHMTEDEASVEQFEREKSKFEKHGLAAVQEINKNMVLVKKMYQNHKAHKTAELILRIDYELRDIHKELSDYRFQAERVFNLLAQGKLDKADQSIQKIMKKGKEEGGIKHDTLLENLLTAIENYVAKSIVQAQRDQQVAMITMAWFSSFVFLLSITLGYVISRSIRKPLQVAVDVASRISAGQRDIEIAVNTKDETGLLLSTMKKMSYAIKLEEESLIRANEKLQAEIIEREKTQEKLKETHERLIEASHQAGMAEVATDVLHNVGNVLNSINVSTTLISDKMRNSKVANLGKVVDMIKEHDEDLGEFLTEDSQGKHIPVYLDEVSKLLTLENYDVVDKLEDLADNVEHVKEIVSMQQSYAKVAGFEITVSLTELLEDTIKINSVGLKRHGVELVREFEELGEISIDKQKVVQILVNLINNAKYALTNNGKDKKLLTIRAGKHGEDRLRIEVIDNGVGIAKDNLNRIFQHGFTTKKHGHGFGLHSGALAAKELGGSLTVDSGGPGTGATFTLDLPYKPAEVIQ